MRVQEWVFMLSGLCPERDLYLPRFHEESQRQDSIWMHTHSLQHGLSTSASPCDCVVVVFWLCIKLSWSLIQKNTFLSLGEESTEPSLYPTYLT